VSKREEFEGMFCLFDESLIKTVMYAYDRGHADGLSEGEELRGRLVEAIEDITSRIRHSSLCKTQKFERTADILNCDCILSEYDSLIAEAKEEE